MTGLDVPPLAILLAIYLLYLILGTILEGIGMFLLTLPVIFPVIEALGYDPIWFGIILVKLTGIASLSPPVGLVCSWSTACGPTSRWPTSSAASGRSSSPTSSPSPLPDALPETITWLPDQIMR